jgi:hypothetical protein
VADASLLGGDLPRATHCAEEALRRFRELGLGGEVRALHTLARVAMADNDLARAAALAEEAIVPYRVQGHTRDIAPVLLTLAQVRADQGDVDGAISLVDEARALFQHAHDRRGEVHALEVRAGLRVPAVIDLRETTDAPAAADYD